jgi:multidrug transporter EmrE-like cation transporter
MIREILMIIFVTLSTMASQLLVKNGVNNLAERMPGLKGVQWLMAAVLSPSIIGAVAIQGVGFLVWVVVVSRMKLGVAFALSGGIFYFLIALSSWFFFGEKLALAQWAGLSLISAGVLLMALAGKA